MDFEKHQKRVEKLEKAAGALGKPDAAKIAGDPKLAAASLQAMKTSAELLRDILMDFLKDRREQVRPGHLFRDAAAKGIVPGESFQRGDNLLIKWGGRATPTDPRSVGEDAVHFATLLGALVPILKAYRKEEAK